MKQVFAALLIVGFLSSTAFADFTITQGSTPGTVYTNVADFDDAGVPTGVSMNPWTFYQAAIGISFGFGDGTQMVADDWATLGGILGSTGNSLGGGFSIPMFFDQNVTELSFQGWATGGGPGAAVNVFLYDDGVQVETFTNFGSGPFPGPDNTYFNVVATNGDSFDEVRFFNGAFSSFNTYMDNVSFNSVPEPSSLGLLALAGLAVLRRKR